VFAAVRVAPLYCVHYRALVAIIVIDRAIYWCCVYNTIAVRSDVRNCATEIEKPNSPQRGKIFRDGEGAFDAANEIGLARLEYCSKKDQCPNSHQSENSPLSKASLFYHLAGNRRAVAVRNVITSVPPFAQDAPGDHAATT
jgi:hypothetical protein